MGERMKKVLGGAVLLVTTVALAGDLQYIKVEEAQVRGKPSFLGKVKGKLPYGSQVDVQEKKGAWAKVAKPAGWLHSSALSEERLALISGERQAKLGASSGEVALAGKGFGEEVEQKYKQKGGVNYAAVDKLEKQRTPLSRVVSFVQEGKLKISEGGE